MKFTNKLNLPQPIVAAVTEDTYSRGNADISVTQLIEPPRKVELERVHADILEEDVSDRIWSMFGTAIHNVLDSRTETKHTKRRLSTTYNGWTVSGEFDYIDDDGILWDWKVGSVWEIMNGVKETREPQLNLYGLLAALNGTRVTGLRLGFILRDWSQRASVTERGYPPFAVHVVPVAVWDSLEAQTYLEERVRLHQKARVTLPECTDEERWAKPKVWAATKAGNTRATKLFATENEALAWHQLQSGNFTITKREGELTRCKFYCTVGKMGLCEQYNNTNDKGTNVRVEASI